MARHSGRILIGVVVVAVLAAVSPAFFPFRALGLRDRSASGPPRALRWEEVSSTPSPPPPPSPAVTRERAELRATARPVEPPADQATKGQPPATFTLRFGPFATLEEVEDVERRLDQVGVSTLRHRVRSDSALYKVTVGEFWTPEQAEAALEQLRSRHPRLPLGRLEMESGGRIVIPVGPFQPLLDANALAHRLRADGLRTVGVRTAPDPASLIVLRLRTAYDLKAAQEKSRELREQGVANAVVPVQPSAPLTR